MFIFCLFCTRADAIKIGLQTDARNVKIAASVAAEIYDGSKNNLLYDLRPMQVYEFKTKGRELVVSINRQEINLNTNLTQVTKK